MIYSLFRLPSGLSLLSSPPAWRSMARPWRTSWTATRVCSTGGTTGSTALWTSDPTPKTCPPSALTSPASSSSTTRPGPTDPIQVPFITWRKIIIHRNVLQFRQRNSDQILVQWSVWHCSVGSVACPWRPQVRVWRPLHTEQEQGGSETVVRKMKTQTRYFM